MTTRNRNPRLSFVGIKSDAIPRSACSPIPHNTQVTTDKMAAQVGDIRVSDFRNKTPTIMMQETKSLPVTDPNATDLPVSREAKGLSDNNNKLHVTHPNVQRMFHFPTLRYE